MSSSTPLSHDIKFEQVFTDPKDAASVSTTCAMAFCQNELLALTSSSSINGFKLPDGSAVDNTKVK